MSNISIPFPTISTIVAVLGYLAGIAGTILGAINAGNWSTTEQAVITAISGVVGIVTHHHTTAKAVSAPPVVATRAAP